VLGPTIEKNGWQMSIKPEYNLNHIDDRLAALDKVKNAVEEYIEYMWSDERLEDNDENYQNHIFETAVLAIMGPDAFIKITERMVESDD